MFMGICVFIRKNVTLVTLKNAFPFQKNVFLRIFGRKCGGSGKKYHALGKTGNKKRV
jgi:hypothetical protein